MAYNTLLQWLTKTLWPPQPLFSRFALSAPAKLAFFQFLECIQYVVLTANAFEYAALSRAFFSSLLVQLIPTLPWEPQLSHCFLRLHFMTPCQVSFFHTCFSQFFLPFLRNTSHSYDFRILCLLLFFLLPLMLPPFSPSLSFLLPLSVFPPSLLLSFFSSFLSSFLFFLSN